MRLPGAAQTPSGVSSGPPQINEIGERRTIYGFGTLTRLWTRTVAGSRIVVRDAGCRVAFSLGAQDQGRLILLALLGAGPGRRIAGGCLSVQLAYLIFGKRVFRLKTKGKWELSIPLYDAIMIAIFRLWDRREQLVKEKTQVIARVENLLNDSNAYEVIVGRPNTAQAIRHRLRILTEAVGG